MTQPQLAQSQPAQPQPVPQPQPQPAQPQPAPQPQPQPAQPQIYYNPLGNMNLLQPQQPQPVQPVQPPKAPTPYEVTINQQNEQIQALIAQNGNLMSQIAQLVQGGAQISTQQPIQPQVQPMQPQQVQQVQQMQQVQPQPQQLYPSLSDDNDWSLEALAKEIGVKDK